MIANCSVTVSMLFLLLRKGFPSTAIFWDSPLCSIIVSPSDWMYKRWMSMQAFYHVPEVFQLICQRSKVMFFFELLFYADYGHSAYHFAKTVLALMCIFNASLSSFPKGVVLLISFVQQTLSNFVQLPLSAWLFHLWLLLWRPLSSVPRSEIGSRAIQTISLLQKLWLVLLVNWQ